MKTERLIEQLVADLVPVRRLARPGVRLGWWLLISVPAAALVAWVSGLRPDLMACFSDPAFLLEEMAAAATALTAAYAALCAGLPDQPVWKLWLPLAPMAVWIATLGRQCLDLLFQLGPPGLPVTSDAMCIPAIALGGLVPLITILVMLRRSRGFRTTHACLCGALSAAALGAAALRLYHPVDAALMVIVWQLGSVALWSLIAGAIGWLFVALPNRDVFRARA